MKIGIFALQGDVIEHKRALEKAGAVVVLVRSKEDMGGLCGIILPGGESTTVSLLMRRYKLFAPLKKAIASGLPTWGTCAGAILLAKKVTGKKPPLTLGAMDIVAERNAYGGQRESFMEAIVLQLSEQQSIIDAVFIRAPKIKRAGMTVRVLARRGKEQVMLRQDNMLATSFHPELREDLTVHKYFVGMCKERMLMSTY